MDRYRASLLPDRMVERIEYVIIKILLSVMKENHYYLWILRYRKKFYWSYIFFRTCPREYAAITYPTRILDSRCDKEHSRLKLGN